MGVVRDLVASIFFAFGVFCSTASFYFNSRQISEPTVDQSSLTLGYFASEAVVISFIGIVTLYLFNLMLKKYFSGSK